MAFDYDENGTPVGVAGGFNYDENGRPIVTSEKDPGYLGEAIRAGKRGFKVTVPDATGKALKFFGAEETGQSLIDSAKQRDTPDLQESAVGKKARDDAWYSVRGNVAPAADNAVLSMAPGAAGAAIGAGIGSVVPVIGTAAGALAGYAIGSIASLPIFYGSQAQEAYDAVLKHQVEDLGTPLEEAARIARNTSHAEGLIEAGGELVQDIIPFAKLLKPFGKVATKAVVSSVLKPTLAAAGKTVGQVVGGEVVTEMAQQAGEDAARKAIGDTGPGATWEETRKVIMPTALMSVLPGGAGAGAKHYQQTVALNALSSPETDADMRAQIAVGASVAMADGNPDVARAFAKYASDQIAAKAPIEIKDDDQFYLQYRLATAKTSEEVIAAAEAALAAPITDSLDPAIDAFKAEWNASRVPADSALPMVGMPDQPAAAAQPIVLPGETTPAAGPIEVPHSPPGPALLALAEQLSILPAAEQTKALMRLDTPMRQAVVRAMQPAGLVLPDTVAPPGMGEAARLTNETTMAASSVQPVGDATVTNVPALTQRAAQEIVSKTPGMEMRPHREVANRFEVVPIAPEPTSNARAMPATLPQPVTQQVLADQETPAVPAVPAARPVVPAVPLTPAQIALNQQAADAERSSAPRKVWQSSTLRSETGPDIKGEKVTRNMRKFLSSMARLTGTKIVYEFAPGEADGAVPVRDQNEIHINTAAQLNPMSVMGHEITHVLKDRHRDAWNAVRDALVATMPDKRAALDAFAADYWSQSPAKLEAARAMKDWSKPLTAEQKQTFRTDASTIEDFLLEEMVSDLGGQHWTSEQFWIDTFAKIEKQHGSEKAKGIIQQLVSAIKETLAKFLMVVRAQKQDDYTTITPEQLTATRDAVTSAYAKFMSAERLTEPDAGTHVTDRRIRTSDLQGSTREGGEPVPAPERQQAQPTTGDELDDARARELAALSPRRDQRLFFEVAPNPKDPAAVAAWQQRTDDEKQKVSKDVVDRIIPGLLKTIGAKGDVVMQLGGWKQWTNPSFALVVTHGDPGMTARAIGYVLDQEAVYALGMKPFAGGTKTGIIEFDLARHKAHDIYKQVRDLARGIVTGHSTIGDRMLIGMPMADMQRLEPAVIGVARKNGIHVSFDTGYGATIKENDYGIRSELQTASGQSATARNIDQWRTEARDAFGGRPDVTGNERVGSGATGEIIRSERREGAVSAIGIHYSQKQREYLSSSAYGTGLKGAEAERVMQSDDPRIKHRVYFYINAGNGIRPEQGVGPHAHRASLTNLYDLNADTLNLALGRDANEFEGALLDAGYSGYLESVRGWAVLLGPRSVPVTYTSNTEVPIAERGVSSQYRAQLARVEANKSLPAGQMTGEDWKRIVPTLMPEMDVSHLDDTRMYYKDQIVPKPETARMSEPRQLAALQKIENGKLTMDGEYGYNTFRSLWKDAEEMRSEYPDERTYDLYKDNGGTGVVYGAGGYSRYAVTPDGTLRPIPESFANKDKLAEAQAALTEMPRMTEARLPPPAPWYYSALGKAAETAQMKSAPASGWKDWLKSLPAKGVKPDEIKWSGVEEWLDVQGKQPVTREQVQSFLSEFGVKVETILRGERNPRSSEVVSQENDADEEPADLEISFGEWETDEPDESWLADSAGERLKEAIDDRVEQSKGDIEDALRDHVEANVTPNRYVDDIRSDAGKLFPLTDEELDAEANRRAAMDYAAEHWQSFADDPDITLDDDEDAIAEAMERAFAVATGDEDALADEAERRARAEIDEDKVLEELIDQDRQYYYDDYDSPQTRTISVDGVDDDFYHSSGYGDQQLSHRGDYIPLPRNADDADIEGVIRTYLSENDLLPDGVGPSDGTGFVPTKWEGYRTDKGRAVSGSYREVQLTLPVGAFGEVKSREHEGGIQSDRTSVKDFVYTVHWNEKNVIGHARFDEHIDEDGKRVMVLQEVQGDWGQQLRDGLKAQAEVETLDKQIAEKRQEQSRARDALRDLLPDTAGWSDGEWRSVERLGSQGLEIPTSMTDEHTAADKLMQVSDQLRELEKKYNQAEADARDTPDPAPFIEKTVQWAGLVMKRMIAHAIEYGFDKVVWTSGAQQVERWRSSLRKEVDTIAWEKTPEGIHIRASKNGKVRSDTRLAETVLSDHIGKTMARQIISDPNQSGEITGNAITISDTGMAGFYDRMLPNVTNEILKKLDKSVRVKDIEVHPARLPQYKVVETAGGFEVRMTDHQNEGALGAVAKSRDEAEAWIEKQAEHYLTKDITTQQGFEITDKIRESAAAGMPLFSERRKREAQRSERAADDRRAWYYSQLGAAVNDIPRKIKTGKEAALWLTSNAGKLGVKKDELVWSGVLDWLATQPTPAGVQDWLAGNGVRIRETVYGKPSAEYERLTAELETASAEVDRLRSKVIPGWPKPAMMLAKGDKEARSEFERLGFTKQQVADMMEYGTALNRKNVLVEKLHNLGNNDLKYPQSDLWLPGGKNAVEIVLSLPHETMGDLAPRRRALQKQMDDLRNGRLPEDMSREENAEFDDMLAKYERLQFKPPFTSTHYSAVPNAVAHLRVSEHLDADGKRVLLIDEIQSDWAQKGRKEGFADPTSPIYSVFAKPGAFLKSFEKKSEAEVFAKSVEGIVREEKRQPGDDSRPPLAPFVTDTQSWTALALKRAIAYAIDNSMDRIAWTTGEQQIKRYWNNKLIAPAVARWKDISKPDSSREQPDKHFGRELAAVTPLKIVDTAMLGAAENDKVKQAVVGAIPVDVVDVLSKNGFTTKQLVSDPDMVGKSLPVDTRPAVARGLASAFELVGTRLRAALLRVLSTETGRRDEEVLPAVRASDLSGREVMRFLTTSGPDSPSSSESSSVLTTTSLGSTGSRAESSVSTSALTRKSPKLSTTELAVFLNRHAQLLSYRTGNAITEYVVEPPPGEGMHAFYDQIVPQVARKLGAKVTQVQLAEHDHGTTKVDDAELNAEIDRIADEAFGDEATPIRPAGTRLLTKQPGFDLADMQQRMPLFSTRRAPAALNQWAGETVVRNPDGSLRVMYHGTARDITEFRPKQVDAIFLTDSPKFAGQFADLSHGWMLNNYKTWMTPEQIEQAKTTAMAEARKLPPGTEREREMIYIDNGSASSDKLRRAIEPFMPSDSNIMPLYVRAENPFDYRNPEHVKAIERELGTSWMGKEFINGEMFEVAQHIGDLERGDWNAIESPQVQAYIKQHHDSFYVRERGETNLAVFSPNQVKSAIGNSGAYSREDNDIRRSEPRMRPVNPRSKAFRKWSNGNRLVTLDESRSDFFKAGEPVVVEALHGTTGDVEAFDMRKVNIESDLGGGIYATNTPEDVSVNYAGEGPDLKRRIELMAERIAGETGREYNDPNVIAEAKKRLSVQHGGMAMKVFIRFDNPVVLGGKNETFLSFDEAEEYGESTGDLVKFIEVLREVSGEFYDNDIDKQIGALWEDVMDHQGLRASQIIKTLQSENYATDSDGNLADKEVIRRAFEAAGYDGFIDQTVSKKFPTMAGMSDGTVHYIAFSPTQIKSAISNTGAFSDTDPRIQYSTPRSRITGQPINQTWTDPDITDWDNLVRKMQDDKIDTKRVLRAIRDAGVAVKERFDAYLLETNYHGRAAARVDEFADGELRKLLEDMAMRNITQTELDDYLWARHAPERNAQNAKTNPAILDGSGMTDAQSADILAGRHVVLNDRTIQLPTNKLTGLAAVARRVDAITSGTLDLLVSYGLETQQTVDTWKRTYAHYAPLKRDMESDANYSGAFGLGNGTGSGFNVGGPASKRALGSKRAVTDVLANVAMQRERAITRGEKNRVAQAVYGLALSAPNGDFWLPVNPELNKRLSPAALAKAVAELVSLGVNPIDAQNLATEPIQRYTDPKTGLEAQRINPALRKRDDVLSTRINGEDRYVFFSNKKRAQEMVRGLKNLDAAQVGGFLQLVAPVTRWFASINTQYNPIFGLTNGIRDFSTGMLNLSSTPLAGKRAEVAKHALAALKGIYLDLRAHREGKPATSQYAQLFEQFVLDGGKTGYRDMFASSADRAEAIADELKHAGKGQSWLAVGEQRSHIFGWLSDYNTAVENAMRLSAYKVALDSGMSRDAAASLAKNLTVNFNKKGLAATQTGALYAFFNASVQGTARIAETTLKDGKLTDAGKKILYGGMMLGVLQAVLGTLAGWDDDEPPQFSREKNFIIPIPGTDKVINIPMPLGFHVIPNIGRISAEFALGGFRDPGKRLVRLAGLMLDAFDPIGSGTLAQTLSPTIGDPIVALSENKDWTGKSIYKEDFDKMHPTPGWTRTKDSASPPSRWMAYGINYITGGGKYGIGMASPTPDTLDYLVGQATGGTGRELLKTAQYVGSKVTGEELPMHKVPFGVGRFIGETKGQSSEISRFYRNLERIGEHKSALDEMKHAGDSAAIREYLTDNPDAKLVELAGRAQREIGYLRRQKRELIEKNASKERVKLLDDRITATATRYNEMMRGR